MDDAGPAAEQVGKREQTGQEGHTATDATPIVANALNWPMNPKQVVRISLMPHIP
jgi:hypothetical protein